MQPWSHLLASVLIVASAVAQMRVAPTQRSMTSTRYLGGQSPETRTRVALLRAKAQEYIEQERTMYSDVELQDMDRLYRSAHHDAFPMLLRRDAGPILRKLVAEYPMSTRAGCAVLDLGQLANGEERERYLKQATANHSEAWCESGVQVGALARARLAIYYAELGRLAEAEQLAGEMLAMFPGAIDPSGAPLDDLLRVLRLLR